MLEKQPSQITLSDLQSFCDQKVAESTWLDYKQAYSQKDNKQVAKIVSAMANTNGGWVFFGIEETADSNGRGIPASIRGVPKSEMLAMRIKQICLNSIHPPIIPDIATISLEDDALEIVIVRVFESEVAPHELPDDRIYVRASDISHLTKGGKPAALKEIESLLNRRSALVQERIRLHQRAIYRHKIQSENPQIYLSLLPSYPASTIVSFEKLVERANLLSTSKLFSFNPTIQTAHDTIYRSGVRTSAHDDGDKNSVCEMNRYGQFYFGTEVHIRPEPGEIIQANTIVCLYVIFLTLLESGKFFASLEFEGKVEIILGYCCSQPSSMVSEFDYRVKPMLESAFQIQKDCFARELTNGDLLQELLLEFLWSGGFGPKVLTSDKVKARIAELTRQIQE